MSIKNHKAGITLIEVILAIIVFGIGVIVVMGTITSNIGWLYDIRSKDTAIMMAKEGIDMMYHIRDSNEERNALRNCADPNPNSTDACDELFIDGTTTKHFTIGLSLTGVYTIDVVGVGDAYDALSGDNTLVYYHTGEVYSVGGTGGALEGFWYDHEEDGGEDTGYRRWITIQPADGYESNTNSILEVTSNVAYIRGSKTKTIVLQSFIGDIR